MRQLTPSTCQASTLAWMLLACVGCSHPKDTLQQALDKAQRTTDQQNQLFASLSTDTPQENIQDSATGENAPEMATSEMELIADDSNSVDNTEHETDLDKIPFPDRTNPFEFAAGVDFDAPQTSENKDLEVKLFGFVGALSPKAIINVGGRTKTLAEGEKWGVLEVVAVNPPSVRIKTNGVVRVWSLLGQR